MPSIADITDPNSVAAKLRRRRFALFESLLNTIPRPFTILDVGGTEWFWEYNGLLDRYDDVMLVLLNLDPCSPRNPRVTCVVGDVRDMRNFHNKQFPVVFSNSVIEHVGDLSDQRRMVREMRRVGERLFLQTPNRYFPIEPHFLFPWFQFLPHRVQGFLVANFRLGWMPRASTRSEALDIVRSIRLIEEPELMTLFPNATITREMFCGMVKSFIVCEGWTAKQTEMRL